MQQDNEILRARTEKLYDKVFPLLQCLVCQVLSFEMDDPRLDQEVGDLIRDLMLPGITPETWDASSRVVESATSTQDTSFRKITFTNLMVGMLAIENFEDSFPDDVFSYIKEVSPMFDGSTS